MGMLASGSQRLRPGENIGKMGFGLRPGEDTELLGE